jgi:hypothetical protein
MKEILLSQGRVALVDDDDFEWVNMQGLWSARRQRSGLLYAVRREGRKYFYMHRVIMEIVEPHGIPSGLFIDHKDGNGLNNQRHNLEAVTLIENTRRHHASSRQV